MIRPTNISKPRTHNPDSCHHGDAPRALVQSALQLAAEDRDWNFSLRKVARRAGVSKRIKNMKYKCLSLVLILCALVSPIPSWAQQQASDAETGAPLLTLDEAVGLALQHNWNVKNSVLEVQKQDFEVGTARSRRKPQFQFSMLGGELLHPFDFTIPQGSLGNVCEHWANPFNQRQNPHARGFYHLPDWQYRSTADTAVQDWTRNSRHRAWPRHRSGRGPRRATEDRCRGSHCVLQPFRHSSECCTPRVRR